MSTYFKTFFQFQALACITEGRRLRAEQFDSSSSTNVQHDIQQDHVGTSSPVSEQPEPISVADSILTPDQDGIFSDSAVTGDTVSSKYDYTEMADPTSRSVSPGEWLSSADETNFFSIKYTPELTVTDKESKISNSSNSPTKINTSTSTISPALQETKTLTNFMAEHNAIAQRQAAVLHHQAFIGDARLNSGGNSFVDESHAQDNKKFDFNAAISQLPDEIKLLIRGFIGVKAYSPLFSWTGPEYKFEGDKSVSSSEEKDQKDICQGLGCIPLMTLKFKTELEKVMTELRHPRDAGQRIFGFGSRHVLVDHPQAAFVRRAILLFAYKVIENEKSKNKDDSFFSLGWKRLTELMTNHDQHTLRLSNRDIVALPNDIGSLRKKKRSSNANELSATGGLRKKRPQQNKSPTAVAEYSQAADVEAKAVAAAFAEKIGAGESSTQSNIASEDEDMGKAKPGKKLKAWNPRKGYYYFKNPSVSQKLEVDTKYSRKSDSSTAFLAHYFFGRNRKQEGGFMQVASDEAVQENEANLVSIFLNKVQEHIQCYNRITELLNAPSDEARYLKLFLKRLATPPEGSSRIVGEFNDEQEAVLYNDIYWLYCDFHNYR